MNRKFCNSDEAIVFLAPARSWQSGARQGPFDTIRDAFDAILGGDGDEINRVLRIDLETMKGEDITDDTAWDWLNTYGEGCRSVPAFVGKARFVEWADAVEAERKEHAALVRGAATDKRRF